MPLNQPGIQVTVRCFAAVREALGTDRLEVTVPTGCTVEGLRTQLAARGHAFSNGGEIGAAAALEFLGGAALIVRFAEALRDWERTDEGPLTIDLS